MVSHPIRNLFTGLIDYAGLFPPAKLDMDPAVTEYARQRRSPEAWMLSRFIVPATRLQELEEAMDRCRGAEDGGVWPLSVLVGGDLGAAKELIDAFNLRNAGRAAVEAIEHKPADPAAITAAAEIFEGFEAYFEVSHQEDPTAMFRAIRRAKGRAKIRTGGVTDDAFPSPDEVSRFIRGARMTGIPFKATAGLHHPLRGKYRLTYEDDAPAGTMHGFLNVFLTAAFVHHGELPPDLVPEVLKEQGTGAFEFSPAGVAWRGHRLSADELARARHDFATSYGSCSFAEPVEDLKSLRLL